MSYCIVGTRINVGASKQSRSASLSGREKLIKLIKGWCNIRVENGDPSLQIGLTGLKRYVFSQTDPTMTKRRQSTVTHKNGRCKSLLPVLSRMMLSR